MTLPPPDPPDAPDAPDAPVGSARRRRWRLPPVWRRRLVIAGGLVLVLGLVALASITLLVSEDDTEPTWEAVAVLDEDSGQITAYDAEGEQLGGTATGLDDVIGLTTRGEHALVHYDGTERAVALVDLVTGDVDDLDVGDEHDVDWATTTNAPVVLITGRDDGGVTLVDAATRTTIDVAETAGLTSPMIDGDEILSSADGSVFAMTDRNSFQTVLIDIDTGEPLFVPPGELVAMSDDTVMTLQRTGQTGDVTFTSLDGERNAPAQVPTPVAVDLVDEHTAVLATADGRVLRVGSGDREPTLLVDLADELQTPVEDGDVVDDDALADDPGESTGETSGEPVDVDTLRYLAEVDRLIVRAGGAVVVLSPDGDVVERHDDHDLWRTPDADDDCVAIVSDDGEVQLIDAESGEVLTSGDRGSSRSPESWSDDGCTVDTDRSPSTVLTPDRTLEVDGQVVEIADDGTAVLSQPAGGTIELTWLDDDRAPIELEGDVATFITTLDF